MGALHGLMAGLNWGQDTGTVTLSDLLSFISVKKYAPRLDCSGEITAKSSVSLHESFPCGHKRQDRKSINFEGDCFPLRRSEEKCLENIWMSIDEWSKFLERFKEGSVFI